MRYEPLTRFLESKRETSVRLTFREIETVLQRSLPPSARRHQAWWANTATHSHAGAWLRSGWRTRDLDRSGETVVFGRAGERAAEGVAEGAAPFHQEARSAAAADLVTFDRAKLNIASRKILDDYTERFNGDVQRALDVALEEARIAYCQRLIDSIPSGPPSPVDSVDLIREDRDAR